MIKTLTNKGEILARKPNQKLIEQITQLNSEGKTDSQIARELVIKPNLAHHYRNYLLNLEPNWNKETYMDDITRCIGYMLRNLRYSAKRRGIEFNLTLSDLHLTSHCPLLGLKLTYNPIDTACATYNDASHAAVDRLDNSKGYVKGNVWIISRLANNMKNCASLEQLELFCTNMQSIIKSHRALGSMTDPKGLDS